ncbi:unnamed protein product [Lactuca virosa]|uniref:Uncharacterized protein n=1 Tax=Lactuca virosa TaxID=75947 RepID=A0AAU9LWF3_9ASTR|nr:unnamed protein product [Lactuca virosa]
MDGVERGDKGSSRRGHQCLACISSLGAMAVIAAIYIGVFQASLVIPHSSTQNLPLNLFVLLLCCALLKIGIGLMQT